MLAGGCRFPVKLIEVWPGRFGVHEIRRQRRDAAPIVDARGDELCQHAGAEVRWRLNIHLRSEQDTSNRNGPEQIIQIRLRRFCHLGVGLGAKVLNDDFLQVPIGKVQIAQRKQGFDSLATCFSDSNQYSGCERHTRFAGFLNSRQTHIRTLVG